MAWAALIKWIIECHIAAEKAISLATALLAVVLFYLTRKWHGLLQAIQSDYGNVGAAAMFVVVFAVVFCIAHLASSAVIGRAKEKKAALREKQEQKAARDLAALREKQKQSAMQGVLASLTPWQGQFLMRFIREGRRQIPEWEVGMYRAAWEHEVVVLIRKRIIFDHGGVYEIAPDYYRLIQLSLATQAPL